MRLKAEIQLVQITPARQKEKNVTFRKQKQRAMRTMCGKLGYLGFYALPVSAFASRFIQKLLPEMNVSGVKLANVIARHVLRRSNEIVYGRPEYAERNNPRIVVFVMQVIHSLMSGRK